MAEDFGAFKRKMHEALDEAFRAREQDSYEKTAHAQKVAGQAQTATQAANRELEEVNIQIAAARERETKATESATAAEARLAVTEDKIAAAELKLRAVQDTHRELVTKMTAAASV